MSKEREIEERKTNIALFGEIALEAVKEYMEIPMPPSERPLSPDEIGDMRLLASGIFELRAAARSIGLLDDETPMETQ
jgi:hypothetical protein